MRPLVLLLSICPFAARAQPAENDSRTLQTLLSEVQQLRLAIERSTLLGARTQLAISQLQLQEGKAERLSKDLLDARERKSGMENHRARLTEEIKALETKISFPDIGAQMRAELDKQIRQFKLELEAMGAQELRFAAREGELASQAMTAQREVQESRAWISEMQRQLDAAIQQMLKPR